MLQYGIVKINVWLDTIINHFADDLPSESIDCCKTQFKSNYNTKPNNLFTPPTRTRQLCLVRVGGANIFKDQYKKLYTQTKLNLTKLKSGLGTLYWLPRKHIGPIPQLYGPARGSVSYRNVKRSVLIKLPHQMCKLQSENQWKMSTSSVGGFARLPCSHAVAHTDNKDQFLPLVTTKSITR